MDAQVLEVEKRTAAGKGGARKLRKEGRLPAVLYGHRQEPQPVVVSPRELFARLRASGMGRNTLFTLKGLDREVLALLRDIQSDPVKRVPLHLDLIEVRQGDVVEIPVPLEYEGRPVGVVAGGSLEGKRRTLRVKTSPLTIPARIKVNVTHLNIADSLHVSDLEMPEGVTPAVSERLTIALIRPPRVEKTDEEGAAGAASSDGETTDTN